MDYYRITIGVKKCRHLGRNFGFGFHRFSHLWLRASSQPLQREIRYSWGHFSFPYLGSQYGFLRFRALNAELLIYTLFEAQLFFPDFFRKSVESVVGKPDPNIIKLFDEEKTRKGTTTWMQAMTTDDMRRLLPSATDASRRGSRIPPWPAATSATASTWPGNRASDHDRRRFLGAAQSAPARLTRFPNGDIQVELNHHDPYAYLKGCAHAAAHA